MLGSLTFLCREKMKLFLDVKVQPATGQVWRRAGGRCLAARWWRSWAAEPHRTAHSPQGSSGRAEGP
jgi:hypothetical protein